MAGQGTGEVVALHHLAAHLLQRDQLLAVFHAFRGRGEAEGGAERDDAAHHHQLLRVDLHLLDEGAVDLQAVQRQLRQVGERRIAGAEIVQRQPHAQVLERAQG